MPITASELVRVGEKEFPLHHVQASDETRAIMRLCMIQAEERRKSLAAYLPQVLREQGLEPCLRSRSGHGFLESVEPVHQKLVEMFGEQSIGIIVLINGEEPGQGKHSLDEMRVEQGDVIQVIYRIAWAISDKIKKRIVI
ncbi:hypothetical protein HYZ99_01840 [Candidatus Peregrinibacteria bacterium]|nr:hypothetical protein [Candidatus Peregrinibacteria bacterium]